MNSDISKTIQFCRICQNKNLTEILALGKQPPANSLRKDLDENLPEIPLTIKHCDNCKTIQLSDTVNSEYLFRDYVWVTGTSKTAHQHSRFFYEEMVKRSNAEKLFVVEVASNDGTFLIPFQENGHQVLGVDPANNIAEMANEKGIQTISDFFGEKVSQKIVETEGKADVVFARNVIPHVENVHDVIKGMANTVKDDGIVTIEFHYSKIILDELHYDSIYHEHLFYYSLRSILFLVGMYDLHAFDAADSPISGGSLILYCSKNERTISETLQNRLDQEDEGEVNSVKTWESFAEKTVNHGKKLKSIVEAELAKGSKIIGYGASARSSTLLNFADINKDHLALIADKSSIKHGKYTPGTNILITSPEKAFSENPDTVLLLAWNFKDELLEVLKEQFQFKGKVILPLPNDSQIIQL